MPSFQTIQDLSPDDRTLVQSILAKNARDRSSNEVDILAARASVINNRVVLNDPDNYIALASGNTIPDGMSGFAKEALFIESDAANGTVRLYANSGDESQANFKPIGFPTNGLTLVNTTADNTISVDQNGNVGTNVSTDGAVHIENTGNTGIGLGVYTNIGGTADAPLVSIKSDNAAFDQNVVEIYSDGASPALFIDQNGNSKAISIDSEVTTETVVNIDATQLTTGRALNVYCNSSTFAGGVAGIALVDLKVIHASSTGHTVFVQNQGTGNGLRIDAKLGSHIAFVGDSSNAAPEDGDFWFDGTNFKVCIGTTVSTINITAI